MRCSGQPSGGKYYQRRRKQINRGRQHSESPATLDLELFELRLMGMFEVGECSVGTTPRTAETPKK